MAKAGPVVKKPESVWTMARSFDGVGAEWLRQFDDLIEEAERLQIVDTHHVIGDWDLATLKIVRRMIGDAIPPEAPK